MPGMKRQHPNLDHVAFRADLIELLRKHGAELKAEEMLAIAAYTVGQLVALQDMRTMTPEQAMALVSKNIEQGNQDAIREVMGTTKQ